MFAHAVADPVNNPPVANINMDPGGRFAFVEFQKEDLATKALEMDRVVRRHCWLLALPAACRVGSCRAACCVSLACRVAGVAAPCRLLVVQQPRAPC